MSTQQLDITGNDVSDMSTSEDDVICVPETIRRVCVSGNIGAGKTTLTKALAKHLDFYLVEEPWCENPYIADFYDDKSLAFKCQVSFLASRFKKKHTAKNVKGTVQDRCEHEDAIFARMLHESGHLDQRDYKTYISLFETLVENMGDDIADVVLLLDVSTEKLLQRVQSRGRGIETSVDALYLDQLQRQYDQFAFEMSKRTCVFRVDWNKFQDTEYLWRCVKAQYDGTPGLHTLNL
jgi:deoxyadenosine/deoxycytidine kinase